MVRVARKRQEECLGKARNPAEGEAKKESSDGPCSERIDFPDIANEGDVRIGVLGPNGLAHSAEKRGVEHPLLGTSGHLWPPEACAGAIFGAVETGIRGDVAYATLPGEGRSRGRF